MLVGLLVYGLFAVGCALARNFPQLLLCRMMQGVGLGLFGPAMLGIAAGFEEKGRIFAAYRSAQTAAGVLAPIAGGYVGRADLGYPFLGSAAATGLATCAALSLRQEGQIQEGRIGFLASARTALSQRRFLFLCLAASLAEMGYVALGIAVPLAGEKIGLGPETIGLVVATYYTVFTLTQLPLGILAERVDRKGLLIGCGIATALAFVGLFLAATAVTMGLCMGGLGASLGAIFVQTTAWVAELAPAEQRSLYMAFFDAIIDLSFIVMPGLVGLVAGLGVQLPFLLCALLASGATLALTFVPKG